MDICLSYRKASTIPVCKLKKGLKRNALYQVTTQYSLVEIMLYLARHCPGFESF